VRTGNAGSRARPQAQMNGSCRARQDGEALCDEEASAHDDAAAGTRANVQHHGAVVHTLLFGAP
jgi:hypothetical protein